MKNCLLFLIATLFVLFGQTGCDMIEIGTAVSPFQWTHIYGKVIDQNGAPIAGVNVTVTTSYLRGYGQGINEYKTSTDNQGGFGVLANGYTPRYDFHKDGYAFDKDVRDFPGNTVVPIGENSAEKPFIFPMWKLSGVEPWIVSEKHYVISPDEKDYTIDLIQGNVSESNPVGDFRVNIKQSGQMFQDGSFKWAFVMKAIDGGFIECQPDTFHYEAPESGYNAKLEYTMGPIMSRSRPAWSGFYLESRGGKVYGRFLIEISLQKDGTFDLKIESIINPNGSRNLEFNVGKTVIPGQSDGFW